MFTYSSFAALFESHAKKMNMLHKLFFHSSGIVLLAHDTNKSVYDYPHFMVISLVRVNV